MRRRKLTQIFCQLLLIYIGLGHPVENQSNVRSWPRETCVKVRSRNIIANDTERLPVTKKFRKFRLRCKWNKTFWFVPLEIFRNKRNSWKGSSVFSVETSQWKFVFHLQISRIYDQFHALHGPLSGQASLVFQQKWRLLRVSFLEAFCKQTFQGYYECSACHVLAPDIENVLQQQMCRI